MSEITTDVADNLSVDANRKDIVWKCSCGHSDENTFKGMRIHQGNTKCGGKIHISTSIGDASSLTDLQVICNTLKYELENITNDYLDRSNNVKVVFNDSVHGHIELHPLLVKIIDTPQFQRLRHIKQLGAGYWVFPGASHNRFEHSIGVAYLAGCLVKILQEKQPELNITKRDILCVQIAGLCHDLGQSPFSHLCNVEMNSETRNGRILEQNENASTEMFDHMVQENGLQKEMKKYKLETMKDLDFIKELIQGVDTSEKEWSAGRFEDNAFLYEIVSNKRNGIGVDKWDYFARDCHHLGISNSFDHQRLLKFARVCEVDMNGHKRLSICYREKEADNICDMFRTQYTLQRQAYQHKTVCIIETMINDALVNADSHFQFSEAIHNMEEYTKITDHIFEKILYPDFDHHTILEDAKRNLDGQTNPDDVIKILEKAEEKLTKPKENLEKLLQIIGKAKEDPVKAKEIIQNGISENGLQDARKKAEKIVKRCLPKFVGEAKRERNENISLEQLKETWKVAVQNYKPTDPTVSLNAEELPVYVVDLDHGMKDKNPIESVYFYSKRNPTQASTIKDYQLSSFLPKKFNEELVRVYYRRTEDQTAEDKMEEKKKVEEAEKCFQIWCKDNFGL